MSGSPNTSLGPAVCRICYSGESSLPYGKHSGEPLISPCTCKGSMGLYHRSCLERWLNLTGTSSCEICRFSFQLCKKYRPFWKFVNANGCLSDLDADRAFYSDFISLICLTPFAFYGAYLCMNAGLSCYEDGEWIISEGIAMLMLALFLVTMYFVWLIFTCIFYWKEYLEWREENLVIYVVDQLSANESWHVNRRRRFSYRFLSGMNYFFGKLRRAIRSRRREVPVTGPSTDILRDLGPLYSVERVDCPDTLPISPMMVDQAHDSRASPRQAPLRVSPVLPTTNSPSHYPPSPSTSSTPPTVKIQSPPGGFNKNMRRPSSCSGSSSSSWKHDDL